MGILGIRNRTENWKTVEHFHCLGDDAKIRIAQKLGEPEDTPPEKINIELFWYGMRDYIDQLGNGNQPLLLTKTWRSATGAGSPTYAKTLKNSTGSAI